MSMSPDELSEAKNNLKDAANVRFSDNVVKSSYFRLEKSPVY